MKVYLCGPINGCTDAECKDWREEAKKAFGESNCVDPMVRDYRGREKECRDEIVNGDKEDVLAVDVVLLNYDKPSVGTSQEEILSWLIGTPVVVWCKPDAVLSPWLHYHGTRFVHSLSDAIASCNELSDIAAKFTGHRMACRKLYDELMSQRDFLKDMAGY